MELPTTPRTEIVVRRTPCEAKVKSKWIEASKVNYCLLSSTHLSYESDVVLATLVLHVSLDLPVGLIIRCHRHYSERTMS